MALISNSLTADEKKHLLILLRRVDGPGALHHLLGDVGTQAALQFQMAGDALNSEWPGDDEAFGMGFEPIQSMNDASKRRLVAESDTSGYGAAAKQMPRPPCRAAAAAHAEAAERLEIPTDALDIHDWGTTIMLVGKYGDLQKSYLELASDRSSDVIRYCSWLEKSLNEKMKPQFHDFVHYLQSARERIPEIFASAAATSGAGFVRQRKGA